MTFDLLSRSKVIVSNESPYMISYMSTIQMESPAHMVTEILRFFREMYTEMYTDRPTDRVTYRAAEAAKNNI